MPVEARVAQRRYGLPLFVVIVVGAATFVWQTGQGLPDLVASHFGASGVANGFMPRSIYLRFMVAFVIGLPALLVFVTWHMLGRPNARINLPNRDYWLAPERREQTIAFIRAGLVWFGAMLVAFLCYAHWLVLLANRTQPALLDEPRFIHALLSFFVAVVIWLMILVGRFRRRA